MVAFSLIVSDSSKNFPVEALFQSHCCSPSSPGSFAGSPQHQKAEVWTHQGEYATTLPPSDRTEDVCTHLQSCICISDKEK